MINPAGDHAHPVPRLITPGERPMIYPVIMRKLFEQVAHDHRGRWGGRPRTIL
jgi:hypothetical protein